MNVSIAKKPSPVLRWTAAVLALIPAVIFIILDPDLMGIGFGLIVLIPLYVALRTTGPFGGIILAVRGSALFLYSLYNIFSGEQWGWGAFFQGAGLGALILISGILFIIRARANKKSAL
jgi:hypothetical protein